MENSGYTRRQELSCTLAELDTYASVILCKDEVMYVKQENGSYNLKIGDGETPIADLPYIIPYGEMLQLKEKTTEAKEAAETAANSVEATVEAAVAEVMAAAGAEAARAEAAANSAEATVEAAVALATATTETHAARAEVAASAAESIIENAADILSETLAPPITVNTDVGKFITVKDSARRPAMGFKFIGKTDQKLYAGKNLIPYPYAETTKTINGITFKDNGDGTLTINGTATANADFSLSVVTVTEGETYTLSGIDKEANGYRIALSYNSGSSQNWSIGESVDHITEIARTNKLSVTLRVYEGETVTNITIKPQLEAGSAATEYEPFVGNTPSPSPDYPQPIECCKAGTKIKVVGKNLFDSNFVTDRTVRGITTARQEDGGIHITGTAETSDLRYFSSIIFKGIWLEEGTYTVSGATIYTQNAADVKSVRVGTFTLTEPSYICDGYFSATAETAYDEVRYIQLERGTQKTPYEPYTEHELTVPCDLYEGDIWYPLTGEVIRANCVFELTGTEAWRESSEPAGNACDVILSRYSVDASDKPLIKCTHFRGVSRYGMYNATEPKNCICVTGVRMRIMSPTLTAPYSDTNALKAFLAERYSSGNPVIAVYKLATPITEQYDPQPISTYEGVTNVTQMPEELFGDMEMEYVADTKMYIDNKFAELSALILEA